ncbi:MAG: hypothetical protein IPG89_17305 [Bacteroidetes bacterium]|nr:hypothetical protein [Bacteroidota bacterium]
MKKLHFLILALILISSIAKANFDFVSQHVSGKMIAVGSKESKLVYVLETGTNKIINSIVLTADCKALSFNADGSKLIVHADKGLVFYDSNTWKESGLVSKDQMGFGANAVFYGERDLAICYSSFSKDIKLVSLSEAKVTLTTTLKIERIAMIGYNTVTDEIIVFSDQVKYDKEKLIASKDFPKDLKYEDRSKFAQENDQKGCQLIVLKGKTGAVVTDKLIPYTISKSFGGNIFSNKTHTICAGWDNILLLDSKKEVKWVNIPGSFNYGSELVNNGETLLIGSLEDFEMINTTDWTSKKVELTKKPNIGFLNYIHDFAFDAKTNKIVGVTSGYTIFTMDLKPAGNLSETIPTLPCKVYYEQDKYTKQEDVDCIKEKFESKGLGKITTETAKNSWGQEVTVGTLYAETNLVKFNEDYAKFKDDCKIKIKVDLK